MKLVVTEKGGESKQLVFDKDEVSVGRVQGNDVVLPKGNISKRHSKISFKDGRFLVTDQKSTNGTYVNGRKIAESTTITAADKVYVGDFIIMLDGDDASTHRPRGSAVPPPPPPPRAAGGPPPLKGAASPPSAATADGDDEGDLLATPAPPTGRGAHPPPPPPARREPVSLDDDEDVIVAAAVDSGLGGDDGEGPPSPAEVDGDEDEAPLATSPPRRPTAALRPVPPLADDDEEEEDPLDSAITGTRSLPEPGKPATRPALEASPDADALAASREAPSVPLHPAAIGSLDDLLSDPAVSSIFITGAGSVHAERNGRIEVASASVPLGDAPTLADLIRTLAGRGTLLGASEDSSLLDARLPDGSRLTAILPPATAAAAAVIRRPVRHGRSLADLAAAGVLSKDMEQTLEACVAARRNLLITGDVAASLALAGSLAAAFRPESRVISIGGGSEISLPLPGWVDVSADAGGGGAIRVAGSLRPDYLIVTNVGAPGAGDVLHVGALGQEGILCTLPARTAGEALARWEALAMQTQGASGVRELIAATFDLCVHAALLPDGALRVVDVSNVKLAGDKLTAEPVQVWKADPASSEGKAAGRFQATGATLRIAAALAARGAPLSAAALRK